MPAAEKGTAFERSNRLDLNCVFSITTEGVVAKDNTMAVGNRVWQIDKTRFRHTLAGCTVTVHEHLDGTISIRHGPHLMGRFDPRTAEQGGKTVAKRRGKGGSMEAGDNQKQVFTDSHTPLEISPTAREFHFSTAPTNGFCSLNENKSQNQTQGGGPDGRVALVHKADRSCVKNRTT